MGEKDTKTKKKKKKSFKHLKILRKALSNAYTGCIVYETSFAEKGNIQITVGDIIDDAAVLKQLEELLTQDISSCELISEKIAGSLKDISPPIALSKVLNGIRWSPDTLAALKESFSNLPPIKVKMVPMHRYAYNDGLTYLMLYQESLKKESFTADDFFQKQEQHTSLEQQIKVLVLGYCLGLITPDNPTPKKKKSDKKSSRHNIAARILKKIRKL